MSRKILGLVLVLVLLTAFVPAAAAAPAVVLDGCPLSFDVPPTIENGRTLVPLRAILEALGTTIYWDASTKTVVAHKESSNTVIRLTIGGQYAYVNNASVELDVPAKIINGRTMVPLRFVSEALGAEVKWDSTTQTITITSTQVSFEVIQDGEMIGWYSGRTKNGVPYGQGIFTDLEGIKYIGEFKNGINIAEWTQGTIQWPDGRIYTGDLKDLQGEGQGKFQWTNGMVYVGEIQEFLADGKGTLVFAEGSRYIKYIGEFSAGKMQGQGSMLFADGRIYVGDFVDDEAIGQGSLIWPDSIGVTYKGEVKNGIMEGEGELKNSNGDVYTGGFKNNLADGQGTMFFADGREYTGEFKQGLMHGQGKMTYPDGIVQEGEWVNGVYQEQTE